MPIKPPRLEETDPRKVNHAIRQLIEGRSNAHGTFTLNASGASVVKAPTCAPGSHVTVTAVDAGAATVSGIYIQAGRGQFTAISTGGSGGGEFTFGIIG